MHGVRHHRHGVDLAVDGRHVPERLVDLIQIELIAVLVDKIVERHQEALVGKLADERVGALVELKGRGAGSGVLRHRAAGLRAVEELVVQLVVAVGALLEFRRKGGDDRELPAHHVQLDGLLGVGNGTLVGDELGDHLVVVLLTVVVVVVGCLRRRVGFACGVLRGSVTFVVIAACGTHDRERQEDGQEPPPALCCCIHVEYPSMVGCVWTVVIQPRSAEDSASG